MNSLACLFALMMLFLLSCTSTQQTQQITIDETTQTESILQTIPIDEVWAGHPVRFCLFTHDSRQYIAYYNANRNMVVGQRSLESDTFELYIMPPTTRKTAGGTSTVLGWDSHNSITMAIDKEGYLHLSGNMHAHPMTYFRSREPNDITTLEQQFVMVGPNEKRCTYPKFLLSKEGELLFHYRDGGSGNGNEIYNIYSCETRQWSRLLDTPFTDGQGLMNAYQSQPTVLKDGWYHVYWMWRDTPDCSTNHDLSYMKSPDLIHWFTAFDEPVNLPATLDQRGLIVDPAPPQGGMLNLAAKMVLDKDNHPVFVYHKYDSLGYLQLFSAQLQEDHWHYTQLTDWEYRWEFSGRGSINREFHLKSFRERADGQYEVDYWHIQHGNGTLLLNDQFETIGEVLKSEPFGASLAVEGTFPGMQIQTIGDIGEYGGENSRFLLKWETLNRNRDRPREKPWPEPSQLYVYRLGRE